MNKKLYLIIGYLALFSGVLYSYSHPFNNYEPSVYTGTPLLFWILISISLFIALICIAKQSSTMIHLHSIVLCLLNILVISFLPVIRGAFFISEGDALTHLSYIQDMKSGYLSPLEILYPGSHILTLTLDIISLNNPRVATMVTPIIFITLYVIFIVIISKRLLRESGKIKWGVIGSISLLPISQHGIHYSPTLLAILYSSLVFYLLICYSQNRMKRSGITLIIAFLGIILFHPQQAVNVTIVVFGFIFVSSMVTNNRTHKFEYYTIGIIASLAVGTWIYNRPQFANSFSGLIISFVNSLSSSSGPPEEPSISQVFNSIDGSIYEVFLKLFSRNLVFVILCFIFVLSYYYKYRMSDGDPYKDSNNSTYFALGMSLIPIISLFIVLLVANSQYFRYFYFSMVIGAIVGVRALATIESVNFIKPVTAYRISLAIILLMTIPIIHPSPYTYQASNQIPEQQFVGYDWTVEYSNTEYEHIRIRSPVDRYIQATNKVTSDKYQIFIGEQFRPEQAPVHFSRSGFNETFNDTKYLPVTSSDKFKDGVLWSGYRYTMDDFVHLNNEEDIAKVYSSGGTDMYIIHVD